MPNVELRECRVPREWRLFERIPELIHGTDPTFVPPIPGEVASLRRSSHPFHEVGRMRAYIAYRAGAAVGRIASIENRLHEEFHRDGVGFFGFFSFTDEPTARALLECARRDLSEAGKAAMRGPFNPTQNDECGLHVEGFGEPPAFGMPYNPDWYPEVYQTLGLHGVRDLLAFEVSPRLEAQFQQRLGGLVDRVRERMPLSVRPIDLKRTDEEARLVCEIFNASLGDEWNFMPLTETIARGYARDLAGQLDPECVLIVELDGEPVGLSIGLPDINEFLGQMRGWPRWMRLPGLAWMLKTRSTRRARWAVFCIKPEYRRRGGTALLIYEAITRWKKRYQSGELSWTQDINDDVNRVARSLGLEPSKRYRIYEMGL